MANGQSPKETWDNLAVAEVRCIVCKGANKVRPSCLILGIWPRSRAGILLLSHHLSSPLCNLWTVTGGFPAAALISVCLSFSISYPRSEASSLCLEGRDAEWKTRPARNNRLSVAEETSGCQPTYSGVCRVSPPCRDLRCAALTALSHSCEPTTLLSTTEVRVTAVWPKTISKFRFYSWTTLNFEGFTLKCFHTGTCCRTRI